MTAKRKKPATAKTQYQRFLEEARALGVDEDEAAFEDKLKKLATAKPADTPKKAR